MGFTVVQGTPYIGWFPVDTTDTIYVGQIVKLAQGTGVIPVGAGVLSGNNTAAKPFGVVVGTANKDPLFNTTYKCEYTTGVDPHAQTKDQVMFEQNYPRGDNQQHVQVAIITAETVLKGPICNASFGTAPTVGTVSAGNTAGKNCTITSCGDVAPLVANNSMFYFRSGANRGLHRPASSTSLTTITHAVAFPYDIAVGDTATQMPFKAFGLTAVQFDSEAMFIDSAGNCNNTGWYVNMLRVDLTTAGEEWAMFMFNPASLATGVAPTGVWA